MPVREDNHGSGNPSPHQRRWVWRVFLPLGRGRPGMSGDVRSQGAHGSPGQESALEKTLYTEEEMRRAISRIAHEIIERNDGARDLLLVGMRPRGGPLAQRLAARIEEFEGERVPAATLDITDFRDDRPG